MSEQASDATPTRTLPFRSAWPVLAGMSVGVLLRLIFSGESAGVYSAMSGSFIYLAPQLVGAVTVYLAERQQRRTWAYYIGASILANCLFVLGTLLILIEGLICAVIIIPFFAVQGILGALVMGVVCRFIRRSGRVLYCFATLPLMLGTIPPGQGGSDRVQAIERHIVINASPATIWHQLNNASEIRPAEVDRGWMYRIGVPLPQSGITSITADGIVRRVTMGKKVYFDQVAVDWHPQQHVTWRYHFYPDSFPAGALDDHVRIGGQYFDVMATDYTLMPQSDSTTRLTIIMQYRVSTDFDWYADLVARLLIGNFEDVILEFYRHRSEANSVPRRESKVVSAKGGPAHPTTQASVTNASSARQRSASSHS